MCVVKMAGFCPASLAACLVGDFSAIDSPNSYDVGCACGVELMRFSRAMILDERCAECGERRTIHGRKLGEVRRRAARLLGEYVADRAETYPV